MRTTLLKSMKHFFKRSLPRCWSLDILADWGKFQVTACQEWQLDRYSSHPADMGAQVGLRPESFGDVDPTGQLVSIWPPGWAAFVESTDLHSRILRWTSCWGARRETWQFVTCGFFFFFYLIQTRTPVLFSRYTVAKLLKKKKKVVIHYNVGWPMSKVCNITVEKPKPHKSHRKIQKDVYIQHANEILIYTSKPDYFFFTRVHIWIKTSSFNLNQVLLYQYC